jgi:hypothetical protein
MGPAHSISDGVNWTKAMEVCLALLASPVIGFLGGPPFCCWLKSFSPTPNSTALPTPPSHPPGGSGEFSCSPARG